MDYLIITLKSALSSRHGGTIASYIAGNIKYHGKAAYQSSNLGYTKHTLDFFENSIASYLVIASLFKLDSNLIVKSTCGLNKFLTWCNTFSMRLISQSLHSLYLMWPDRNFYRALLIAV